MEGTREKERERGGVSKRERKKERVEQESSIDEENSHERKLTTSKPHMVAAESLRASVLYVLCYSGESFC